MPHDTAASCAQAILVTVSRLRRRIREVGDPEGLTPSQRSVISRLDKDGDASASELAVAERVRPQSMGATLGALLDLGLVERSDDPRDGRRRVVSLTDEGSAWLRGNLHAKRGWLIDTLEQHCTEAELATVAAAMEVLDRVAAT